MSVAECKLLDTLFQLLALQGTFMEGTSLLYTGDPQPRTGAQLGSVTQPSLMPGTPLLSLTFFHSYNQMALEDKDLLAFLPEPV